MKEHFNLFGTKQENIAIANIVSTSTTPLTAGEIAKLLWSFYDSSYSKAFEKMGFEPIAVQKKILRDLTAKRAKELKEFGVFRKRNQKNNFIYYSVPTLNMV